MNHGKGSYYEHRNIKTDNTLKIVSVKTYQDLPTRPDENTIYEVEKPTGVFPFMKREGIYIYRDKQYLRLQQMARLEAYGKLKE